MQLTEPKRRAPLSIGAIVDLSLAAYAANARLYLGVAACAFVLQAIAALPFGAVPGADLALQAVNLSADAFLAGCVSIGVAARLRDETVAPRAILGRVARRWWAIALVDLVVWLIRALTFDSVFGDAEATGYYLLVLPTIVLWGTLLCADVIVSIDDESPAPALPGLALLRSIALSFRTRNLWRVSLVSLMTIPATMLPMILDDALRLHGVPAHAFWSSIPLDAILTGPYQALFAVFYLDLQARAERER